MRIVIIGLENTPRIAEAEVLGLTLQFFEGPHDTAAQGLLWKSVHRVHPDVVWCQWESLVPPDFDLIRQYRVLRGDTRLVVELPPDVEPPNSAVSDLVSLGIYDLVVGTDAPMAAVLDHRALYGDAARWHIGVDAATVGGRPGPAQDPEVVAAQTVAVISGKGGVGKTSFVANCLVAATAWGAVGIDADHVKPSLHLAFQSADTPLGHDLDQLMAAVTPPIDPGHPEWSPRDRQTIREWVRQAWVVADGVRVVSGPSRTREVLSAVPPGLVTALAEAGQRTARLTLIDTPGSTMEQSWVESVEVADWVVLVTTPDYPAVLESIDVLRKLDYLHVPRSRVWLVINKRSKAGYSTDEIRHTHLKDIPVLAVIEDHPKEWHQAWRMHRPPALKNQRFWGNIVQKMTGVEPDRPAKKNPFRLARKPKQA